MSTTKSNNQKCTGIDDFVLLGKIGEGSFSTVHKVRRINDGKIYALKRVNLLISRSKSADSNKNNNNQPSIKSGFSLPFSPSTSSPIANRSFYLKPKNYAL